MRMGRQFPAAAQEKETAAEHARAAVSLRVFRGRNFSVLLFVTVEAVHRRDGAKEAVLFSVDSGSEEESVSRSRVSVVAEGEGPQTVNEHERVIGIPHEADEFTGKAIECSNPSAAEISDQDGVAK